MTEPLLQAHPIEADALKPIFKQLQVPHGWNMVPDTEQIGFQNQTNPNLIFFLSFSDLEPNLVEISDYGNVFTKISPEDKIMINQNLDRDDQFNAMYLSSQWGLHFECRAYDQPFDPYQGFKKSPKLLLDNLQKMVEYAACKYVELANDQRFKPSNA